MESIAANNFAEEQTAADYQKSQYTVIFAHPLIHGLFWSLFDYNIEQM